jgi:aromatic ring-opening dioxygenase catalytic subunit (LigB family)
MTERPMRQPAIFLPHGGGPCFFMPPPADEPTRWVALEAYLRILPSRLPARPDALLIISAHWETALPTVLTKSKPGLFFDYYNFPPHTYRLTYPAPGAPALSARLRRLLAEAGIESAEDAERDYDHGIFVPMKVAFPEAEIPILQLSLQSGLDPAAHIAIGKALAPLRDENIVVIGSGLSFHNLRALGDPAAQAPARAFDAWLTHTLCELPPEAREAGLVDWASAPGARASHPREEHLLPLMVAVGAAAGAAGQHAFSGTIWGKAISAYHFG